VLNRLTQWIRARFATPPSAAAEPPVFPRLTKVAPWLPEGGSPLYEPAQHGETERVRLLEAKIEYLLDELYRLKSQVRHLTPASEAFQQLRDYQLRTFDYQWKHLPYHDEFLTNPAWREKAAEDVTARCGLPREWFAGKRVLDCGCGPGRHTWTFASLGATVNAFDMSDNGIEAARKECAAFPNVTIEKRSMLEPLPYGRDYDLVWSYGVVHVTADPFKALRNIAGHVKPGGHLYIMVYAEPRRSSIYDYQYYHEVAGIRERIRHLSFEEKIKVLDQLEGRDKTLGWFDAISSEVNELYTFEELRTLLASLGFDDIRRTMPHEAVQNVVARKR
jgi:2-polyprenyl-3-methyl-5-hydroxy-6-metoxy-1,4-benzoquinol methylase